MTEGDTSPWDLLAEAKRAMKNAYASYSEFLVRACLRASDGSLMAGCNIKNASYGLTLCMEALEAHDRNRI
jgi:cytidine deaminase